jgi:hypothetical protein
MCVTYKEEMRNVYNILVGKPDIKVDGKIILEWILGT